MRTARERWLRFWFEPSSPTDLGFCRLLFFGAFSFYYLRKDFSDWAVVSEVFWMPNRLFDALHLPLLSVDAIEMLQVIWKASLVLSSIGLWTRFSTGVAFLLGVYFVGLPHSFGKFDAEDAFILPIMGILALSRCGESWSVDQWLQATRRESSPPTSRPTLSGEYTWPIRLVWLLMTLAFFAAGVAKLRRVGLEWIFSDNVAMIFVYRHNPVSLTLAQYGWICQLLAAVAVLVEVCAPLALLNRKLRLVIVSGLFFLQLGNMLIMRMRFYNWLVCYIFWVPWERVGSWLTDRVGLSFRAWKMSSPGPNSRVQ